MFLFGTALKNPPANAGAARDVGSVSRSGRSPAAGNVNQFQYSCLKNGQRSLAGYSPWGCKESDVTEQLSTHTHTHAHIHTHYKSMSNFEVAMCALHYLRLVWCITLFDF